MPASHYKRKVKKNVDRNNRGRFRTQPVTFMEIKVRWGCRRGGILIYPILDPIQNTYLGLVAKLSGLGVHVQYDLSLVPHAHPLWMKAKVDDEMSLRIWPLEIPTN